MSVGRKCDGVDACAVSSSRRAECFGPSISKFDRCIVTCRCQRASIGTEHHHVNWPSCSRITFNSLFKTRFHSRTVESSLQDTAMASSGEKATTYTPPVWSVKRKRRSPVSTSHTSPVDLLFRKLTSRRGHDSQHPSRPHQVFHELGSGRRKDLIPAKLAMNAAL